MALSDLITRIDVETTYGPPMSIDMRGPPGPWGPRLKPRVTVYLVGGGDPIVYAPYGDPGQSHWPTVKAVLLLAGFVLGGLILLGGGDAVRRLTR